MEEIILRAKVTLSVGDEGPFITVDEDESGVLSSQVEAVGSGGLEEMFPDLEEGSYEVEYSVYYERESYESTATYSVIDAMLFTPIELNSESNKH